MILTHTTFRVYVPEPYWKVGTSVAIFPLTKRPSQILDPTLTEIINDLLS